MLVLLQSRKSLGWDDNIVGVRVGTHRQLIIPPELAYENKGCGHIGPGEVVVVGMAEF